MPTLKIDYKLAQGLGSVGEPVRANAWEILIPDLGPSSHLYVSNCSLPKVSISPVIINHFNEKSKIAGEPEVEDVSIELEDVINPRQAEAINTWYKSVYNSATGIIGFASDYKKMGTIQQFSSKGGLVRTWELKGIWPINVDFGDGDYTSFEPNKIAVTLSVDRAILVPAGSLAA